MVRLVPIRSLKDMSQIRYQPWLKPATCVVSEHTRKQLLRTIEPISEFQIGKISQTKGSNEQFAQINFLLPFALTI